MEIETKYALRLFFANPTFTQIYYEAVANAFDAGANEIDIHISADGKIAPDHLEIVVVDNGGGFTDERYDRFAKLKEPSDPFHKGLGRLVYLKYFSRVDIVSVFAGIKRSFTFTGAFPCDAKSDVAAPTDRLGTTLRFVGFIGDRLKTYDDLKPGIVKAQILQEFLPYLHERKQSKKEFTIRIKLDTQTSNEQKEFFSDEQTITVSDVPQLECTTFKDAAIDAIDDISMFYMVRNGTGEHLQLTAACIDGRTIPIKLLQPNAIPLNHSAIFLFKSKLFTGKSDAARQRLVLPENLPEATLHRVLRREVASVLNRTLPDIDRKNKDTKQHFEERYPHLTGYFDDDSVGIIDKDEAIDIAQRRFFKQQKEVLEGDALDDRTFEKSLEQTSRTLTQYILYRELIIRRLGSTTSEHRESDIHNLIVPRYKHFHQASLLDGIYSNNAWLLDDKFMSFRTILSEAKMSDVIAAITLSEESADDEGRPDISMIFSADPAVSDKVDVVVVEIKRRMADDKENPYAATQLVKRARKLVDHCPNIQRVWYFAIIEIDDALTQLLLDMRWAPLFSKGKVFYQDFQVKRADGTPVPTPICLLSYDAVIKDAALRNHTFLEILKGDMRRAGQATPA